jgi:membrane fusion protein, multidrug efflux system
MPRRISLTVAVLLVACLGWLGAGQGQPAPAPKSPGPVVVPGCWIYLIDEAVLASERGGIIAKLDVREGTPVKSGETIVGLKDEVPRAMLATAQKEAESEFEVELAQKILEVAEAEHEKARDANTINPKTIPAVEVRRLKLAAERAAIEIKIARHKHELAVLKRDEAAAQLETYHVDAPFEGVVTRVHRKPGEMAKQGEPIVEIASTRRVRIEGDIRLADVFRVKQGDSVSVQLDLPDIELAAEKQVFPGKIVFVDVKAAPPTGVVRVWAEVENPENVLRAGLTARMTINSAGQ